MRYIREHLMFIFPLLAILLGVESFLVFDRLTKNYEQELRSEYSMLVMANVSMKLEDFKQIDMHISSTDSIKKTSIVKDMIKGISDIDTRQITDALPFFYTIHLDSYLNSSGLDEIRGKLIESPDIKKVETFNKNHNSNYNLFIFIKIVLWTFVALMSLTSLFLVIKQMEVWQFAHRERMRVMEIFGASTMLRSGVLYKRAIIDALVAMLITNSMFIFLRFVWVKKSNIELLSSKADLLFQFSDVAILAAIVLVIVVSAVILVVVNSKEEKL